MPLKRSKKGDRHLIQIVKNLNLTLNGVVIY
jgi:hypothetical protein